MILRNKSAVRIGVGKSSGMSRFYFLLPYDKPHLKLPELYKLTAEEFHRAGVEKISGRALANALGDKFPYYSSESMFKSLPRRAVMFMSKSDLFEKNGQQGRSNLFATWGGRQGR